MDNSIFIKIKNHLQAIWRSSNFRVFLVIFCFGFIIFLPATLSNYFSLPMNGDYVLQQVPFYSNAHDIYWHFFKTGEFTLYNYENFIGVNYFPANTFYYLTSPFSIFIIICPKFLIPQLLFFTMIFKMTFGGFFFFILLKKYFNVNEKTAFIGGIIYAFSGWGMFYLWFNHLSDVLAIFPLTLIGAEHLIKHKKGALLAISLFLMGLTNYFFLFTFAITNSIYILVRVLQTKRKQGIKIKVYLLTKGALCFLLGLTLSGIILLPSYAMLQSNPRLDTYQYLIDVLNKIFTSASKTSEGFKIGKLKPLGELFSHKNLFGYTNENGMKIAGLFDYLFKFAGQNYYRPLIHILTGPSGFYFPTWGNWDTLLVKSERGFDNSWSSMYITMPLAILLVPSLITSIKQKKILDVIVFIVLFTLPFIPITYYLLHAFSQSYGRWQIFLMTMALIYTVLKLDKIGTLTKVELFCGLIFTLFIMTFSLYTAIHNNYIKDDYRIYVAVAQIGYAIIIFAFYFSKEHNKHFKSMLVYIVLIELFVNTNIATNIHGYGDYVNLNGGIKKYQEQEKIVKEVINQDDQFFRVFNVLADRSNPNLPMALGYKGLSAFHSVYEYGLTDFANFAKINYYRNNWSMGVHEKRIGLETFLNVKYYIVNNPNKSNITFVNLPTDFKQVACYDSFCIYENPHHYQLGTSYDNFIDHASFPFAYSYTDDSGRSTLNNDFTYLKGPVVASEDVEELKEILNVDTLLKPFNYANSIASSFTSNIAKYYQFNWETNSYNPAEDLTLYPNSFYNKELRYRDLVEFNLRTPIPANSIVNINVLLGPNLDVTMYSTKEKMEEYLLNPELPQQTINKINSTLAHDCHLGEDDSGASVEYCQVTYDSHMIHGYNKDNDHKWSRGFFAPIEISKIQLKIWEGSTKLITNMPAYTFTDYQTYQDLVAPLAEYGLENVTHSNNKISFTTNYAQKRLIILSVPYNSGFSVKVNQEEVKTYKLTSGFLGFVSGVGESQYQVSFFTPALGTGLKVTGVSILFLAILIVFEERKKFAEFGKKISLKFQKENR